MSDSGPETHDDDAGQVPVAPAPQLLRVRRHPRYLPFIITGAAVGVLVAVVSGLSGQAPQSTGRGALVGYLALLLGLLGGVVGAATAVLLDRRRS